jgi:hypothetical protein
MTVAKALAEIVALLVSLVAIQWLSTVLLHTEAFWPLMAYTLVYLGVRAFFFARKLRSVR